MQDRENFLAMLSAIVDQAKSQDNVITMEEVKNLFEDLGLEENQLDYVYEYLAANKIRIQGYIHKEKVANQENADLNEQSSKEQPSSEKAEDKLEEEKKVKKMMKEKEEKLEQEEAAYIAMYLEDLESIDPIVESELDQLIISLMNGDQYSRDTVLKLYLHRVVDIAKEYQGKGVIIGDLIQEGNMGLITALEEISSGVNKDEVKTVADSKNYIVNKVKANIEFMINEHTDQKILENRLIEKLNYISDCLKQLAEEYGREATLQELADYANMDPEEVSDILAIAKNDLSVSK